MKVEIIISEQTAEPRVQIIAPAATPQVQRLAQRLRGEEVNDIGSEMLTAFCGECAELLAQEDIVRIYTQGGKVQAQTEQGEYTLKMRLYEAENRLNRWFVRISQAEIINLKKVKRFDLSLAGSICVQLQGGQTTYVSRRYVGKIKQVLGLKKEGLA